MEKEECNKCGAVLTAAEFVAHQNTVHFGQSKRFWNCDSCDFAESSGKCGIAHRLLEGHWSMQVQELAPDYVAFRIVNCLAPGESNRKETSGQSGTKYASMPGTEHEENVCEREFVGTSEDSSPAVRKAKSSENDVCEDEYSISTNLGTEEHHILTKETVPTANRLEKQVVYKQCANCSRSISYREWNRHVGVIQHSRRCCSIKHFTCSTCGRKMIDISEANLHVKEKCTNASIIIPDRQILQSDTQDAVEKCFPGIDYAKSKTGTKPFSIQCGKCSNTFNFSQKSNQSMIAKQHAFYCHKIMLYACSKCDHKSSASANIRRHIEAKCTEAMVISLPQDKEAENKAIRECFPMLNQ